MRFLGALLASGLISGLLAAPPALAQDEPAPGSAPGGPKVILELSREFYYVGEPLQIRVSVGNDGPSEAANPVKSPLAKGFRVLAGDGKELESGFDAKSAPRGEHPQKIASGAFYGEVVDIAAMFDLGSRGRYEVFWAADGLESRHIVIQLIPRYDPAKKYEARVTTGMGSFTIDFFPDVSPIAVKAFIDMANAGFYDGLEVFEVRTDRLIAGGDPRFGAPDRVPTVFPAEQSGVPVVAGTVLMRPVGAAPPANSSPFMVMLRPEPGLVGQATVLGQVSSGLEIVKQLSRVPSNQQVTRPYYKPLKPVPMISVTIVEKGATEPGVAGGGGS